MGRICQDMASRLMARVRVIASLLLSRIDNRTMDGKCTMAWRNWRRLIAGNVMSKIDDRLVSA